MMQMMQNPGMQQMMGAMLSDPNMLTQMQQLMSQAHTQARAQLPSAPRTPCRLHVALATCSPAALPSLRPSPLPCPNPSPSHLPTARPPLAHRSPFATLALSTARRPRRKPFIPTHRSFRHPGRPANLRSRQLSNPPPLPTLRPANPPPRQPSVPPLVIPDSGLG